jgi:ribonuclease BN (tRNA processing enzyme)
MANFHTGPAELGELATRAKAKMVVLYHQSLVGGRGGVQPSDFVRTVMTKYQGPVMYARDLDIF